MRYKLLSLLLLVAVGCSSATGANPKLFPEPAKKVEQTPEAVYVPKTNKSTKVIVVEKPVEEDKNEVKTLPPEEPKPYVRKSKVSSEHIKFQDGPCPPTDTATPVPPAPPQPQPQPAPNPTPTPPVVVLPILSLPTTVTGNVGEYIKITATTNGSEVRWYAVSSGLLVFPGEMLKSSLSTVVHANQPGIYTLLAYTAVQDLPSDPKTVMVVVNGPQPPPAPTPTPTPVPVPPQPTPTPIPSVVTARNLWIVTIDDVTARTPALAAVLTNQSYWQGQIAKGNQFAIVDKADQTQVTPFMPLVTKNGGIPIIVIMDAATRTVLNNNANDLKIPATLAGLDALISKYQTH